MRRRPSRAVLLLLPVVGVLAGPGPARALPDLVPEVYDVRIEENASVDPGDVVEGCAAGDHGRRLIRFALRSRNVGPDDLVMGDPGCPYCPDAPGAPCANPLFVCSEAHGHEHFEGFAAAELLDAGGRVVASGHKQGFCLIDIECPAPRYGCGFQGITAGCADVYEAGLPCQYVDLTGLDVPDGTYTLRVRLDDEQRIAEADEQNNAVEVPVRIGHTPAVCPTHPSTDVPKAMPDLGTGSSTLVVPDLGQVDGVRVRLAGTHTYLGDLRVILTSPSGRTVFLADRRCGPTPAGFDLYLGDEASGASECPGAGTLAPPVQPLAAFAGDASGGTWTLAWQDVAVRDSGTLTGWSLELCGGCGDGVLDPGEQCDDGNDRDGDCCSDGCRAANLDGAPCSDGDVCTLGDVCAGGACIHAGRTSCPGCTACDPALGCGAGAVQPCTDAQPHRSTVSLRDHRNSERDALDWWWASWFGIPASAFGRPDTTTDLKICLFDQGGLRLEARAPAGGTCRGRPCWRVRGRGPHYADRDGSPDGIVSLRITEGDPAKFRVKARGAALGAPVLPLAVPMTLRLVREDTNACWQATFSAPARNGPAEFKGRSD